MTAVKFRKIYTTIHLTFEVDGSVTNEIQDLVLTSNILKITDNVSATGIDLSPYLDNTDNQRFRRRTYTKATTEAENK